MDYTKIFNTKEELADFFFLPIEQQLAVEKVAAEKGIIPAEMVCQIPPISREA